MQIEKRLKELQEYYLEHSIDEKFPKVIKEQLGIEINAFYGKFKISHPVLVAPGQLTREKQQIERIKNSGYAGCVLKSVVGEDEKGNCSMIRYRKSMTFLKTVYEDFDKEGAFPVILWNGRADVRNLKNYFEFAKEVFSMNNNNFLIVSSVLSHFPEKNQEIKKDEWIYTTKKLYEIGYRFFEIDFCPGLKIEKEITEKENILRIYREIPQILKDAFPEIVVFPKLINLDYGIDFQVKMVEEAIKGRADGIVIGNRIFKEEINGAWGGKELRERNLKVIKEVKKSYPKFSISGTGGIYTGEHIYQYLKSGADSVQILSYILGKVKKPFLKQKGDKFEKVIYELFFNPVDGLLKCYLAIT
ncbi:MAG: hypothetical protein NC899_07445 [Candidatus Omnitrophica bacterium]|nr:hypothetical protein [Candidatus Omnitrophota bacterium]